MTDQPESTETTPTTEATEAQALDALDAPVTPVADEPPAVDTQTTSDAQREAAPQSAETSDPDALAAAFAPASTEGAAGDTTLSEDDLPTFPADEKAQGDTIAAGFAGGSPATAQPAAPATQTPSTDASTTDVRGATSETSTAEEPAPTPKPGLPSPAAFAGRRPSSAAPAASAPSASASAMAFGRADEDGTVYVSTPDGERRVGQYPGASQQDAVAYFARKYDEMWSSADLLYQRVLQGNVSAKESGADLAALREHIGEADVVGDLPALHARVEDIATAVEARRQVEATERAAAREQAKGERERIVAEAEGIAAQDPAKTQWKSSGARIRELLDEWKNHQRTAAKLDRESENALWQRFSAARNSFDKSRRAYFSELESTQGEAKAAKEKLVAEAEHLATSTDWAATAGAFKRLMDQWRKAGRAGRKDDDALWARFKAAQDSFFNAKDEVAAAEDESFRGNLAVKEELLKEAEALLPVKDLDSTKSRLRTIQDKWEAAGKVPRADMGRVEGALRRVEQAVRDAEDARWKKSNPEVQHRVSAFAEQLQRGVAQAQADLEKAQATGDARKIKAAEEALATREQWLKTALAAGDR